MKIFIALVLFSFPAYADFTGMVIKVTDGDTIQVIDNKNIIHKVRLTGIDAPEKKQSHGIESRQSLSDIVIYKNVSIESSKTDRYGRELGKVMDGDKDVSLAQIKAGMAWHYTAYQKEQSAIDRATYKDAESVARAARFGLWRDDKQIPPWGWRKGVRK